MPAGRCEAHTNETHHPLEALLTVETRSARESGGKRSRLFKREAFAGAARYCPLWQHEVGHARERGAQRGEVNSMNETLFNEREYLHLLRPPSVHVRIGRWRRVRTRALLVVHWVIV